jgi:hypothetical protein
MLVPQKGLLRDAGDPGSLIININIYIRKARAIGVLGVCY